MANVIMHPCDNQKLDTAIISMLAQNDKDAWGHLYDKYAPMMYGIILSMTGHGLIATEILSQIFLELKTKKLLFEIKIALCYTLVRQTHKLTIKYLHERGRPPVSIKSVNEAFPIIDSLFFELATLKELEKKASLTKQEILISLRAEFNQFRHQEKQALSL